MKFDVSAIRIDVYHHTVTDGVTQAKLNVLLQRTGNMASKEEILANFAATNEKLDAILTSNAAILEDIAALNDMIQNGADLSDIQAGSAALFAKATQAADAVAATDALNPPAQP